jgi:two-component system, LytTR family, response regulator LytT
MDESLRIAIIEDNDEDAKRLKEQLLRFSHERGIDFHISIFSTADYFLFSEDENYDVAFLDIELPGTDGMTAARAIRNRNQKIEIVFCTSFSQFAIRGYEVHARDYLVKPFTYVALTMTLENVLKAVSSKKDSFIEICNNDTKRKINIHSIQYLECTGHHIYFHTTEGEMECYGSLSKYLEKLNNPNFIRISSSLAVNFVFIEKVADDSVYIGKVRLPISRGMKKSFLQKLNCRINEGR